MKLKNNKKKKPKNKETHKLTGRQVQFVLQKLAEFETETRIVQLVQEEFNVEVTIGAISYYWCDPEWKKEILNLRKAWVDDIDSVPIANKKKRLQHLQSIVDDLTLNGEFSGGSGKDDREILIKALKQAQTEKDGLFGNVNLGGELIVRIIEEIVN